MTRNLFLLAMVSLLQDMASELVYPILPILLTVVLGAPAVVVGLVEGVAEGAASLARYLSGRASDREGRRGLVSTGYALAAGGKVIVAAATTWPAVLVGRSVDRIGKGVRGTPRDALIADGVAPADLGRAFGFHRATDTLGAVLGPLLGLLVLVLTDGDIRVALWVAVVPAVLSVALTFLVRETRQVRPRTAAESRARTPLPPQAKRTILILGLISLANFPDALVLLRVSQLGFSATEVVLAFVAYNASYALLSYPAGALADRWPRARIYAVGLVCFTIGYLGLATVDGGFAVILLLLVYGGFHALTDGVGKAWITDLVPAADRGRAQGVFQGFSGGAILLAGLWAGLLWETGPGSGTVPLVASGFVAAIGAVYLFVTSSGLRRSASTAAGA